MRKILFPALLLLISAMTADAVPDKNATLEAIRVIESSKKGEGVVEALQVVLQFADESPDVVMLASPEAMPWFDEKWKLKKVESEAVKALLMASYSAGIIGHQLETGKADNSPYVGWLRVIERYEVVKDVWKFESPGIKKLIALQKDGKLEAYAAKVSAKKN